MRFYGKYRFFDGFKNLFMAFPRALYRRQVLRHKGDPCPALRFSGNDHFPHRESCIEWWYFSGILETVPQKSPIGFHATFFRIRPLFEGRVLHLSITDPGNGEFRNRARYEAWHPNFFDRPYVRKKKDPISPGTAESILSCGKNTLHFNRTAEAFRIKIRARTIRADLSMRPGDLMPLGRDGRIDVSYLDGGCYYYAVPNLKTTGAVEWGGKKLAVAGMTWFDHQWGNFPLTGLSWQWFSLRFDKENLYVMIFHFTGPGKDNSFGNILCGGKAAALSRIEITSLETAVLKNGKRCPVAWDLCATAGEGKMSFRVRALMKDQFIHSLITPSFWEGLCAVEGEAQTDLFFAGKRIMKGRRWTGTAYAEVAGLG